MRNIESPSEDERGNETHPAFALIGASRVQNSAPGTTLFDSDIRHQHSIIVRIKRAERKRDLNHDWIHSRGELIEVELSEAQWASFVSSMNTGDGTPATLRWTAEDKQIPGLPFQPRLAESMREVRDAADKTFAKIADALAEYEAHKTVANLRALRAAVENAGANLQFAASSLTEHAENVVQRARADIEAFVVNKAQQLGVEPASVAAPLEIESKEATE